MARRWLRVLALAAVLVACGLPLARCLPGSAPLVKWKARQTARSLPPPPEGAVLLAEMEHGAGGTDCNATSIDRVYGTRLPLPELVDYYARELTAQGWEVFGRYGPDSPEAITLTRGNDALFSIVTESEVRFESYTRSIPPEKVAEYPTLYVLDVTVTCGGIGTELEPTAMPGSPGK